MKEPLSGLVICVAGDFGEIRAYDKMKQWIETNGGAATKSISSKVTHLVCSKAVWKNQNSIVQAALKQKHVNIVSYDWLEDSLHSRICRSANPYLWRKLEKDIKIRKHDEKAERKKTLKEAVRKFKAGHQQANIDLQSDNHHIYRDATGFVYNITLNRANIQINRNERYRLTIYESNTSPPYLYACTASYTCPGFAARSFILTERGSHFVTAFAAFRKFFKAKTGVDWDQRLHGIQTQQLKSTEKVELYAVGSRDSVGKVPDLTLEEKNEGKKTKYYAYTLPDAKKGEPMGELGLLQQVIEKHGMPQTEMQQIGGEASEDETDEAY